MPLASPQPVLDPRVAMPTDPRVAMPTDPRIPPGWQPDPDATIRSLQGKLHMAEQTRLATEAKLQALTEQYDYLNGRLARGTHVALQAEIDSLKAHISKLEARIADLQALDATHASTVAEWKEFEEKTISREKELKKKDKAREKWASDLRAQHTAQLAEHRTQISFLQQQYAEIERGLQNQLAAALERQRQLESDLAAALQRQHELETELQKQLATAKQQAKAAENALEPLYAMATQLQEQVDTARDQLSDADAEKQAALDKVQVLQAAVDSSSETIAAMQRDQAELAAEHTDLQFRFDHLTAERDEAIEEARSSAGAITHLREAVDAARAIVESTRAQLSHLSPLYEQATEKIVDLNAALDRSAGANLVKQEKIDALTAEVAELKAEVKKQKRAPPPLMSLPKRTRTAPARYGLDH